jgi:DNA-binding CsgD family transcriptional regulator
VRGAADDFARAQQALGAALSDREAEVLRLIAMGYSNKEVASRLRLSVKTVATYKTRSMNSMKKLGARSRVDIVRYAARCGWLGDGPHPVRRRARCGLATW